MVFIKYLLYSLITVIVLVMCLIISLLMMGPDFSLFVGFVVIVFLLSLLLPLFLGPKRTFILIYKAIIPKWNDTFNFVTSDVLENPITPHPCKPWCGCCSKHSDFEVKFSSGSKVFQELRGRANNVYICVDCREVMFIPSLVDHIAGLPVKIIIRISMFVLLPLGLFFKAADIAAEREGPYNLDFFHILELGIIIVFCVFWIKLINDNNKPKFKEWEKWAIKNGYKETNWVKESSSSL